MVHRDTDFTWESPGALLNYTTMVYPHPIYPPQNFSPPPPPVWAGGPRQHGQNLNLGIDPTQPFSTRPRKEAYQMKALAEMYQNTLYTVTHRYAQGGTSIGPYFWVKLTKLASGLPQKRHR